MPKVEKFLFWIWESRSRFQMCIRDSGYTVSSTTVTAVTNAAIDVNKVGTNVLTVGASTVSGSAISKLDAGTYQVTAVVYTLPAGKADSGDNYVKKTIQKSFTIEDKQDIVKVSFTGNTVDVGTCLLYTSRCV